MRKSRQEPHKSKGWILGVLHTKTIRYKYRVSVSHTEERIGHKVQKPWNLACLVWWNELPNEILTRKERYVSVECLKLQVSNFASINTNVISGKLPRSGVSALINHIKLVQTSKCSRETPKKQTNPAQTVVFPGLWGPRCRGEAEAAATSGTDQLATQADQESREVPRLTSQVDKGFWNKGRLDKTVACWRKMKITGGCVSVVALAVAHVKISVTFCNYITNSKWKSCHAMWLRVAKSSPLNQVTIPVFLIKLQRKEPSMHWTILS